MEHSFVCGNASKSNARVDIGLECHGRRYVSTRRGGRSQRSKKGSDRQSPPFLTAVCKLRIPVAEVDLIGNQPAVAELQ